MTTRQHAINIDWRFLIVSSLLTKEKVDGHTQTDTGDEEPHPTLLDAPCIIRPTEPADDSAHNHQDRLWPHDSLGDNEGNNCHTIDCTLQQRLHGIHFVDILHPHQSERGEHEDTNASPKIAAVDR